MNRRLLEDEALAFHFSEYSYLCMQCILLHIPHIYEFVFVYCTYVQWVSSYTLEVVYNYIIMLQSS